MKNKKPGASKNKKKKPHVKLQSVGRVKLPEKWSKALAGAQNVICEVGRMVYVDNHPVSTRDMNFACAELEKIAAASLAGGLNALKKAQSEVEKDTSLSPSEQIMLLLGVAEMQRELIIS